MHETGERHKPPGPEWVAIAPDLEEGPSSAVLSRQQARRWALLLEARRIPCRCEQDGSSWQLLVPTACRRTALRELRLFEEENRRWPPAPPAADPPRKSALPTLSLLLLLGIFHNLTLLDLRFPGHGVIAWMDLGAAEAGRILAGEWWRLITALTLHADWLHLAGNLAIGSVFILQLCRQLGSGTAWSLILASGVFGNLLNAFLQSPVHRSVGASTALFGAVGLLAALGQVRYGDDTRRRRFLPPAAALALLALFGASGENTDIGAHLFGFAAGFVLGMGAARLRRKFGRPGRRSSAILAAGAAFLTLAAWVRALQAGL